MADIFDVQDDVAAAIAVAHGLRVGRVPGLRARPRRGHAVVRSLGPRERYGVSIGWARFHLACGELESAAEWFARAIDERYSMVGAFLHSAMAGSLRRSAHWPPLARLMNLPT